MFFLFFFPPNSYSDFVLNFPQLKEQCQLKTFRPFPYVHIGCMEYVRPIHHSLNHSNFKTLLSLCIYKLSKLINFIKFFYNLFIVSCLFVFYFYLNGDFLHLCLHPWPWSMVNAFEKDFGFTQDLVRKSCTIKLPANPMWI